MNDWSLPGLDGGPNDPARVILSRLGATLDGLDVAMCVLSDMDTAVTWNRTFLKFFPEHAGHIHRGEPYASNLTRFYEARLEPSEVSQLQHYVQEGLLRHRAQQKPFSFDHHGRRLHVNTLDAPGAGKVRIWRAERDAHTEPSVAASLLAEPGTSCATTLLPQMEATLLDHIAEGVMVTDPQDRIVWVNEPFIAIYGGAGRMGMVGRSLTAVYRDAWGAASETDASYRDGLNKLAENIRFAGAPFELSLPGNRWIRVAAQRSPDDKRFYVHVDITPLKRQQQQLQAAEAQLKNKSVLLEATLERMAQGIMMVNRDRVVEVCNRRAIELLDLPPQLMASRPTFGQVLAYQWSVDEFMHSPQDLQEFVRAGGILDQPHCYDRKRPDGRVIEVQSIPIEGGGVVRTYADITERRAAEERIHHLATHDGLTALANRETFLEALHRATQSDGPEGSGFAVYYIDLDKFKAINDGFGHAVGDKVLVEAARRMAGFVRAPDLIARLGGDEFAILKYGLCDAMDAQAFSLRLLDALQVPMQVEQHRLVVDASVGMALHHADGLHGSADADVLLRAADAAMYRAKAAGASGRAEPGLGTCLTI